jgi:hypothetical protein
VAAENISGILSYGGMGMSKDFASSLLNVTDGDINNATLNVGVLEE